MSGFFQEKLVPAYDRICHESYAEFKLQAECMPEDLKANE